MANNNGNGKSLESWIWDAACSIRGAKDAPKYKDLGSVTARKTHPFTEHYPILFSQIDLT